MRNVQLLYFPGCPHVDEARDALKRCRIAYEEIDTTAVTTPSELRGWASPTILIDGRDLAGEEPSGGPACRVYPSNFSFEESLRKRLVGRRPRSWVTSLASIGGAIVSILPVAACPACLGAYAALIASLGAGALLREHVLLPLTFVFLAVSVGTIGWATRRHRNFLPLVATLIGSTMIVGDRPIFTHGPVRYSGALFLLLGAIANFLIERKRVYVTCCAPHR